MLLYSVFNKDNKSLARSDKSVMCYYKVITVDILQWQQLQFFTLIYFPAITGQFPPRESFPSALSSVQRLENVTEFKPVGDVQQDEGAGEEDSGDSVLKYRGLNSLVLFIVQTCLAREGGKKSFGKQKHFCALQTNVEAKKIQNLTLPKFSRLLLPL